MKKSKNSKTENLSSTVTEQTDDHKPLWGDSDSTTPIPDEILFNMIPENIREDIKRFPRFFTGFYNRQLDGISNLHTSENTLLLEHQINTQLKLRFAESLINI